ncbi:ABC transporter ATP-binding protein [Labrenzia sp. PHM005]|uniref:ABC transporter ATP-binding protein n=1 Tax=Labrenzia sp. PHM005 TaxID=2590016 RepID=UPI00113FEB7B|nr:ABC transporter ATP-binding protein [Labrenzia sp. PHM005]QDG77356.1 ABC transporter ATP-binding protein [Labrenzia sp. PHM005]
MTSVLNVSGITAGYGGASIIEEINLDLAQHEIAVVIGPNGAGKSTLLKTIFALTKISDGSIRFMGKDITGVKTNDLVPLGISAVPQNRNVFPTLTIEENLDIGTYASPPNDKKAIRDKVLGLFPDLVDKLHQPAGELSGGQRQMAAMGRALMSEPSLLLLDEPTAGLSPAYLEKIFDLLLDIRKNGVTILMVEQNAKQALRIADMGHVLVNGRNFVSDTGAALLADESVRRSFLGGMDSSTI